MLRDAKGLPAVAARGAIPAHPASGGSALRRRPGRAVRVRGRPHAARSRDIREQATGVTRWRPSGTSRQDTRERIEVSQISGQSLMMVREACGLTTFTPLPAREPRAGGLHAGLRRALRRERAGDQAERGPPAVARTRT